MNKNELANKIRGIDGLTNDEKSALIELLRKQKKYGLVWEDKPENVEERLREELPVLIEDTSKAIISEDADAPNHILIEGDNLEALTALAYTHEGKIDVIYIDPPYNTGKKDEFKYNDKYVDAQDDYRHSKWLSFMSKRLRLAQKLLKKTGIIFISIDDNEVAQLKCICDEIFNTFTDKTRTNCLGVLVWDLGTGTQAGHFTRAHEYVLVYALNKDNVSNFSGGEGEIDHSALKKISKKNPPVLFRFKAGTKFLAPNGTELYNEWGDSEKTKLISGRMVAENGALKYDVELEAGFAMVKQMKSWFNGEFTVDSKGQQVTEFYFNNTGVLHYKKQRSVINPPSVIKECGSTKTGSTELSDIIGSSDTFGYPKPSKLIKFLLSLQKNDITVLDFFAGSGTTLQATMQLNAEDGGNRKFIMVQLPEKTDEKSEAYKAGYQNICEIGKERIRRAGAKIKEENPMTTMDLDVGFRVLKCDSTNMKNVYYHPDEYEPSMFDSLADNIKEDRTPEDLLFQVMLDLGVLLSSKIEQAEIAGKKAFNVADNFLIACFDENVTDETITAIAKQKPYYFVMRDSSLASDSVATNFDQIFATYSPDTVRKVL